MYITIKVWKQVASHLAKKLLACHPTGSIGYYLCLFMKHNSGWVTGYIHACTDETHSIRNLQDLIPILASLCCL